MRVLEVFGFKHNLTGLSDHPVDAPDGTSELMLSSGISSHVFNWVLLRDVNLKCLGFGRPPAPENYKRGYK